MPSEVSVIVCTHNPRPDFLERTVQGLRAQTLSLNAWELVMVDNCSDQPLSEAGTLDWHPRARVVRENELGLTPARVRGIREAEAELLVFVDDDNVLAADYAEQAARIGREWPVLGAWGGGITPWFESAPSAEARSCAGYLTLREVKQ